MGVYEVFVWVAWVTIGLASLAWVTVGCVRWVRRGGVHDLAGSLAFFLFSLRQGRRKDHRPLESKAPPSQHVGLYLLKLAGGIFIVVTALINVITAPFARGAPSSASGLGNYQPEMVMTIEAEQVSSDDAVVSALTDEAHDTILDPHLIDIRESDQRHYVEALNRLRHHVREARVSQPGVAAKADELADSIRQRRVQGRAVLDLVGADDDTSTVIETLARATEPMRQIADEMAEHAKRERSARQARKREHRL